ncbi:MAG: NAD(P)/FAD-dependent oxidoreductase [Acidobacteriaceae bacterium]|nr:NAD(P)/FAD-dependent oxidoreductase [Acidobacteriaceae bacterium]MBV9676797.1 NAD(P)/FAD-dependent oxidoreductase [Acidobacteriaceae bacterium]
MQLSPENRKQAVIIGAGPAGLTAAFELLTRTDIVPVVLEKSDYIGGISRTVNYKGNRIDIGGHRFFSKSDRVMQWWLNIMPMQAIEGANTQITYQRQTTTVPAHAAPADPETDESVMLVRNRKSRIYFMRKFFDYPITLSGDTLSKLGIWKTIKIGLSYLRALIFPIKPETNLEQFFINRFGRELYLTFFKSYTEKVWGIECKAISAEWGAQRIKGLSILKTITHILKKMLPKKKTDIAQKDVETSLIEQFLYPKYGPGQMWEEVAGLVKKLGGEILMHWDVEEIQHNGKGRVTAVVAKSSDTGETKSFTGDYFFSTMPMKELVADLNPPAPPEVREISDGLVYRDFITVGVLCSKIKLRETSGELVKDNWIYIQEPDVLVGRLQIFNNWSPSMVANPDHIWIGLEYFCNEGDSLWNRSDAEMIGLAKEELASMNILESDDIVDATVIRMPKTYPAYFGSYDRFPELISYVNEFENLFLVGRNGMHKYNNQDHSMLTAMTAVDNIIADVRSRDNLWALNTEQEYHEEKQQPAQQAEAVEKEGEEVVAA